MKDFDPKRETPEQWALRTDNNNYSCQWEIVAICVLLISFSIVGAGAVTYFAWQAGFKIACVWLGMFTLVSFLAIFLWSSRRIF